MKYRTLGRTGVTVGEIGMGLEHLLDKEESVVINTIRAAIDGGVNYLDCHPGHDFKDGSLEYAGYAKLSKALEGVRDKLCIICLAPCRSFDGIQPRFENYLRALKTDHTDVFILACCDTSAQFETATGAGNLLDHAKKLRAEGKVRHIGISTHSSDIVYKAIESGDFDVIMYPVNPSSDIADGGSDENSTAAQPRKSVYSECERNNIALVAMKPFAGGAIFREEVNAGFTPLNLISYTLAQNGVSAVVPGCTGPRQIEEILNYYNCPPEARDYSDAVAKSKWSVKGDCLYCNHCLPCSADINVAEVNRLLDGCKNAPDAVLSARYAALAAKASACTRCGECLERCPFEVDIIGKMKRAVDVFENITK